MRIALLARPSERALMSAVSRIRRQLSTADALGAVLFCAALVQALRQVHAAWPFVTDDAFVTLRYSKQLAAGAGLRFNAGEAPVEGYSNFSYVLLGAATLHLPGGPLQVLRALNVVSLCLSLSLTYVLARRHVSPVLAAAPVWVLATYKGTAWWTASGLETAFAQALVTGVALQLDSLLARREPGSQRRAFAGLAGVLCLLALTRPEGTLLAVVVVLLCAYHSFGARRLAGDPTRSSSFERELRGFAFAVLFSLAFYHTARFAYFQHVFPNSVRCKSGYATDPMALQRELGQTFAPFLILAGIAVLRLRSLRVVALVSPLAAEAIVFVGAEPSIAYLCRHFLAVLPAVLVAATLGLSELVRRLNARPWLGDLFALLLTLLLAPPVDLHSLRADAEGYALRQRTRSALATWIDAHLPQNAHVMIGDCGVVTYESTRNFIDAYCLNSLETTSAEVHRSAQKFASYVLDAKPEAIVLHSFSATEMVPQTYLGVFPAVLHEPRFAPNYTLSAKFFADRIASYWVFVRNDLR
jgi:hypothetical protein